ncbi:jg25724, partial [Pararge aegeria aegeria]
MFQKAVIIASLNWIAITTGLLFGQVAGIVNSLQKREEDIHLSESQISVI